MTLLSSSPLLASLFVSYANQAAALESTFTTPSPGGEELRSLQNTIVILQERIEKLTSENLEAAEGLEAAAASQEAFRSQVSFLKDVSVTQQDGIKTLRVELSEAEGKYDRLLADSNAERATFQTRVLGLEVRLGFRLIGEFIMLIGIPFV